MRSISILSPRKSLTSRLKWIRQKDREVRKAFCQAWLALLCLPILVLNVKQNYIACSSNWNKLSLLTIITWIVYAPIFQCRHHPPYSLVWLKQPKHYCTSINSKSSRFVELFDIKWNSSSKMKNRKVTNVQMQQGIYAHQWLAWGYLLHASHCISQTAMVNQLMG